MMLIKNGSLILILILSILIQNTTGQDSESPEPTPAPAVTPTPTQQEQELDEKIRMRKKEKELANLNKEIRAAQPTPSATALEGNASGVKDLKMEINLQGYKSIRQITNRIACEVRTKLPDVKVFIFYTPGVYNAWRNYRSTDAAIKQQLRDMESEYAVWFEEGNEIIAYGRKTNLQPLKSFDPDADGAGPLAAISTALLGGGTAVRSLVDLLGMFRSDVEYFYSDVSVNENALKSMVSDSLRRTSSINGKCAINDVNSIIDEKNLSMIIYDPDTFYPLDSNRAETKAEKVKGNGNNNQNQTDNRRIQEYINALSILKRGAEVEIAIYEIKAADITKLRSDIATLETAIDTLNEKILTKQEAERELTLKIAQTEAGDERTALEKNLKSLQSEMLFHNKDLSKKEAKVSASQTVLDRMETQMSLYHKVKIARLRQLNADFGKFFTEINNSDSTTQISPLMQYTKIESLDSILENSNARWLEVRSVVAGGSNRIQKNLLRYFYKPDVSFSGGSIIEFSVSNKEGVVLLSNTESAFEKYRKSSKIIE